ncbi:hypothetical protein AXG89_20830 [Burkholderia sp. PAMC 26561]|nr:hypothetical protein AXG89_20830 [Burkholderia sp. PAMC 26561]
MTRSLACSLLAACEQLYPPSGLRGVTCATFFGLMAATSLGTSEATGFARTDVKLEQRLQQIQHAKYGKSRWVPAAHFRYSLQVNASMHQMLPRYASYPTTVMAFDRKT